MSDVVLTAPAAAAAGLLLVAGVAKMRRPDDTARALRQAHLPAGPAAVRAGAAGEAIIGVAALVAGAGWPMVLAAASYVAFGAFVLVALARGWPLSSCGCFGQPDTPPTAAHVAVNGAAAAACGAAAQTGAPSLWSVMNRDPVDGAVLLLLAVLTAALAVLVLGPRARLAAARSGR